MDDISSKLHEDLNGTNSFHRICALLLISPKKAQVVFAKYCKFLILP